MLPDGKTIQGTSNQTTSFEVAKAISRSLSENPEESSSEIKSCS